MTARSKLFIGTLVCGYLWAAPVIAVTIEQPLADPVQEQQAQTLFHALKCVVCEGQSLADSDATLARQMRAHIRTALVEGTSPDQVIIQFRDSYGDRILMNPPFIRQTWILWGLPILVLLLMVMIMRRFTRADKGNTDG